MLEDADGTDDLALFEHALLALGRLASAEVGRITDDLLGLDGLVSTANTNEFAVLIGDNLVNGLVKHVGASVDRTEPGEGLRELAKTVQRVNVWRLAIASHRRSVQDDAFVCRPSRLVLVTATVISFPLCTF